MFGASGDVIAGFGLRSRRRLKISSFCRFFNLSQDRLTRIKCAPLVWTYDDCVAAHQREAHHDKPTEPYQH